MYQVNKKKKKNLIYRVKKKINAKATIPMLLYKVFFYLAWAVLLGPIFLFTPEIYDYVFFKYSDELYVYLLIIIIALCLSLVIAIIPVTIKRMTYKHYLDWCIGRKNETITLDKTSLRLAYTDIYAKEKSHVDICIPYSEISKLVYDRAYMCLKIYKSDDDKDALAVADYFDDFNDFVFELAKKSGQQVHGLTVAKPKTKSRSMKKDDKNEKNKKINHKSS